MAKLIFRRESGQLLLVSGHRLIGRWDAHNNAEQKSKGPWPDGKYPWSHYNPHADAGLFPAAFHAPYGSTGAHIFSVHGRPGLGVHAGRTVGKPYQLGGLTDGCIRVPSEAMYLINDTHKRDPVEEIEVTK